MAYLDSALKGLASGKQSSQQKQLISYSKKHLSDYIPDNIPFDILMGIR